ncbi:hypothetical protein VCHC52A1_3620, partial [Vibrio cholerae HC-52A1]
MPRRDWI